MFLEGGFVNETIRPICEKIKSLYAQKEDKQRELEIIRGQKPPQKPEPTSPGNPVVVEEVKPSEAAPEPPAQPEENKPEEPQSEG